MNTSETIKKLLQLPKYGSGIGLHRMQYLTAPLQETPWWKKTSPINIVGTDGKGSVATIIAAILHELGIHYGKYTSPHLFKFNERIEISEKAISDSDLELLATDVLEFIKEEGQTEQFSAFEIYTAIALRHFHYNNVAAVILEAGIGGRYDSTRIFTGEFAALTSVSLEHTEILGKTLEEIAFDKMDIVPPFGTLILGQVPEELLTKIDHYATLKLINLIAVQDNCVVEAVDYRHGKMILDMQVGDIWFSKLESNLVGEHQISNIQVAILLTQQWLKKHYPKIAREPFIQAIYQALPNLVWAGRFEKISIHPPIYIDVGHTLQAIQAIFNTLKQLEKSNMILVVGFSKGRPIREMLQVLYPMASEIICTQAYHKGTASEDVFEIAQNINPSNLPIFQEKTIEAAVDLAKEKALDNGQEVIVLGSLFLAIEAFYHVNGQHPQQLSFF